MLSIRTEGHRIDWLCVLGERVDTAAPLHVPQSYRGIERSGCEDQVCVWIIGSRARGRPFYRIDLL